MEELDIFDENYQMIGTCEKKLVHKLGYWHQVFGCLFIDSEKNTVYLQYKNGLFNDVNHVNKLDISVGGHLKSGETIKDGIREIKEESSLDVNFKDLYYIGVRKINKVINSNYIIREFSNLFLYDSNFYLDKLKSIDKEVLYFVEFDIDCLLTFFKGEIDKVVGRTIDGNRLYTRKDFIEGYLEDDQFYLNYLLLAKEYIMNNNKKDIVWKNSYRW